MTISRRNFLKLISAGSLALTTPRLLFAQFDNPDVRQLETRLQQIINQATIGLEVRRIDWGSGQSDFIIGNNAKAYFPVASCFKALVVLYYLTHTPIEQWQTDEGDPAYRVAVFSNNPLTGELLTQTAVHNTGRANPIVKFNTWIRETLGIESGIVSWDWPNSPTIGWNDRRYSATADQAINYRGRSVLVDNVYRPYDLGQFWSYLLTLKPLYGWRNAQEVTQRTLELFSIPAPNYQSPIERAWGAYIGKDGVIPAEDTPIGARVVNDSGIVLVGHVPYVITAMSLDGEYHLVETLKRIMEEINNYEAKLPVTT
jgi:hypothetical protein